MPGLSDLSPELVVLIAEHLDAYGLASISGTNRYYHGLADPVRFRRGATSTSSQLLFWAARHGRLNVVQRLIDHGADINREDESGRPPPELFLYSEGPSDVKIEVSDGSSRSSAPGGRWTALHLAAAGGHVDIVDLLLESGADLEVEAFGLCECGKYTPAYWEYGMCNLFAHPNPQWTPLHLAVCNGQDAVVRWLVGADASLTHPYFTALHYAAAYGTREAVQIILEAAPALLDQGDLRGFTPMTFAYHLRRLDDIMPYLMQQGADINAPIRNLPRGGDPSLLLYACNSRAYRYVVDLVGLGADFHHRDSTSSMTALHICCAEDLAVLESDVVLDLVRPDRRESEMLQLEGHRLQAVRVLLEVEADVNAPDRYELTPLYHAARMSAVPVAIALVEFGADINFQNGDKTTVLHMLCKIAARLNFETGRKADIERSINHMRTLMNTGRIDHSLRDNHGKLAVDYALHGPDLIDLFPVDELRQVLTTSDLVRIRDSVTEGAWAPGRGPLVMPVLEFLDQIDNHFIFERAETLYSVISGGAQDAALKLLDKRAVHSYTSIAGENLLHVACRSRLDRVIRRLVGMRFDANQVTKTGHTPLSLYVDAALNQSLGGMVDWEKHAAVPFIINRGGDPHHITYSLPPERLNYDYEWQQRPLDRLISRGEHIMAREILDLCPPPPLSTKEHNSSGYSYLHRACSFAHKVPDLEFVQYLLSLGNLNTDAKNVYGRTVLSEAVRSMTPTKPWISPFYKSQDNHSRIFGFHSRLYSPLAHASNFLECVKLLEDHGADWSAKCPGLDDLGEELQISPAAELKQILDWDLDEDDEVSRMGLEIIESELSDLKWNPDDMDASQSPFIYGMKE